MAKHLIVHKISLIHMFDLYIIYMHYTNTNALEKKYSVGFGRDLTLDTECEEILRCNAVCGCCLQV